MGGRTLRGERESKRERGAWEGERGREKLGETDYGFLFQNCHNRHPRPNSNSAHTTAMQLESICCLGDDTSPERNLMSYISFSLTDSPCVTRQDSGVNKF